MGIGWENLNLVPVTKDSIHRLSNQRFSLTFGRGIKGEGTISYKSGRSNARDKGL